MLLVASLLLAACEQAAAPAPSVLQQRQAALDRIADRCSAPRNSFKLLDKDLVTLEPVALASESRGNCLIKELFKSKLPLKLGFISEPLEPKK